ncbi:MAG: hypothetical protein M3Q39_10080 [Actinomycetota bacterium]|nr:hypothetical protein [Actinomycetota bacterium]
MSAEISDGTLVWAVTEMHAGTVLIRYHGAWWSDFDTDRTGISGTIIEDRDVVRTEPLHRAKFEEPGQQDLRPYTEAINKMAKEFTDPERSMKWY